MPKACGLTYDDLRPFMHRERNRGNPINVLDLHGLRATKQTARARDIEDLRHIEAAISVLQNEVSDHVRNMSRRPFTAEPQPLTRGIEARVEVVDDPSDVRLDMASKIIDRANRDGGNSSIGPETLALYGTEDVLKRVLDTNEPITDLDGMLRSMGVDLPRHTT